MNSNYSEILIALSSIVIFSGLRKRPLIAALEEVLTAITRQRGAPEPALPEILNLARSRSALLAELALHYPGKSFADAVLSEVLTDGNIFTMACERGDFDGGFDDNSPLAALVRSDLSLISKLLDFDLCGITCPGDISFPGGNGGNGGPEPPPERHSPRPPRLQSESTGNPLVNIIRTADISGLALYLRKNGAGIFNRRTFFRWQPGDLSPFSPARYPDKISLSDLHGYEDQRQIIIDNTRRFVRGKGANNILLYGDRGTGKSATVKAVCNEYAAHGLRLIEIPKEQLKELPALLPVLAGRGLYFVLFTDDLSFESRDDSFNTLKAVIEGGIEAKPENVVIYATSNRRHLVKEHISDRPTASAAAEARTGGDMRAFDTMQEQFSLADRFGLTVIFTAPSQEEYLQIVEFLALKHGVAGKNLRENALKWERWFNGRSPRTAKQYIDWLAGGSETFPWDF